jgi:predicted ATPase
MSLLVIGCYRLDEVDETHSLSMMVNRLKESKPSGTSKGVTRISEILVKNLGIMDVKEMLQELFSQDSDPALEKLAEICHSKSMGNAFHLTQLILTLHEKGLIEYNFGKLGWTWKVEEIKAKAPAAQNIVDLLKIKLNEQSDDVRKLLAVVSCMSSAAHEMLISKVWESIFQRDDPVCSAPLLQPLLAVALKEGFLEKSKAGSTYRFAHDKVSEAALSLMDQEELSTIKTMVGNALLSEHRLKHLPQHSLFIAVNLLNEGKSPQVNQESNLNLVKINLEVAQKATKASDFSSARRYVARAISLLPEEEKWSVKLYSISLELYSLGAEVEASLGHVDAMNAYCDEILKLKEASLSDKYRVHNVIQDSVLNSGDPDKALVLCLDLLKKLGHSFPRNEVTMLLATISKLLKIQKQVKRMTVHDIQKLPLLTNAEHLEAMYVLDKSSSCCYFNGSKLLPLVVMENYAITMKHGLGRYSPVAFAALSVMMSAILEDFEASAKLVQLIESIQAKLQFPNTTVRVNVILFQHTLPWFKPFQSLLKPAFDGYTLGLSGGDLESGFWFIHCYIGLGLQAGKRLQLLIADCQTYLKQMEETNFLLHAWYQKMVLRFLQELTGEEEPLIAVNTELYPEYEKCDIIQREILKLHKSRMCAIFADHARGAECTNNTAKLNPGTHFAISYPFFRAISLYHQARVTRKAKFRIQARKQHAIINRWAKKGNPNVIHYKLLLDAEAASLIKGMIGETSCLFQTAITLAARSGLTHDTALACERFATFLFYCGHDDSTANYQLNEALRYYQEWGAFAKVAMLQRDYPQLQDKLNTPSGEVLIPPGGELEA